MRDPICEAFDAHRRRRPEVVLVHSAARSATSADVDALAGWLGARLEDARLAQGAVVGFAAPDGPGFLAGLLATRRAGLVAALLDAWSPAAERRRVADALGAAALLELRTGWPASEEDASLTPLAGRTTHPDAAVVKLTSGSTGAPRGVLTPASALAADDDQLFASMGLTPRDRLLSAVPLAHSYGLSSLALPALRRGVPLILPEAGPPFAPLEAAARFGATFLPTTPAWLHALLKVESPPRWPDALRLTISAGAPLGGETAARFRAAFGRAVHTFYGSSECGGICYDREGDAAEQGTVGDPVEGVSVTLAALDEASGGAGDGDGDAAGGAEGGAGIVTGVVTVRSPAVAMSYVPEPDPRLAGGVFTAGDVATWRGGRLALVGRVDDLLNVHGKKVMPREVERVLAELPGVDDVVVVGVPRPETGGHVVRAVIACAAGRVTVDAVLTHARARLTRHKVPRSVVLVREIPRTPRGKIDRSALLAPSPPGADPA